jgi:hypothetical protein
MSQFMSHYLRERTHQGVANRIIHPEPGCGRTRAQSNGITAWVGCSTTIAALQPELKKSFNPYSGERKTGRLTAQ